MTWSSSTLKSAKGSVLCLISTNSILLFCNTLKVCDLWSHSPQETFSFKMICPLWTVCVSRSWMMKVSWKASLIWRRLTTRCRGGVTWPQLQTAPMLLCLRWDESRDAAHSKSWTPVHHFGACACGCFLLASQRLCRVFYLPGRLGLAKEMSQWISIRCQRQHWECLCHGKCVWVT